jgi:hypothetical protein
MLRGILLLIPVLAALAADADDPWKKVRDLKTGTDVRIIKAGAAAPVIAKFAELTDSNLVVIVKNEQVAIPRDKVARIDSRPQRGHLTTETKAGTASDGPMRAKPNPPSGVPSSSTSYSTGVAISDKVGFETIYQRASAAATGKK